MKTLNNEQVKKLALDLMRADTEADVIEILKTAGFWEDMSAWRIFGDNENNYSTIGNQQATPEAAIVEKLINCIDARLILECLLAGINPEDADRAPKTIREAVARFFEKNPNPTGVLAGRVGEWQDSRRTEVARGITFAATGYGTKEGKPSFTISDCGEGQTPQRMPDTLLAYNRSNKLRTAFVQGKFNMGGTGVLKFCGKHNLQLIITRRHPDLVKNSKDSSDREWGVTVIRRDELKGPVRNTVYMYLAPLGVDQRPSKGDVLHFAADTLPIFPEGREAYVRQSAWGTLIKLYEYTTTGSRTNVILKDGMMHRLRILLPEVALPIRFHECRTSFRGHSGSFDTNLSGLMVLLNDEKQKNLEGGYPLQRPLRAGGEEMAATIYAFKKDRGDTYKKREGIIFTINGQTHGSLTKEFFHRKAAGRLGYIADSILVIVDCTRFSNRSREDFIMNSRDRLSGGDLRGEIEQALEDLLKECKELQELRERRQLEATSEILADEKPLEEILTKLLKQSPTLSALFLRGTRIPNPFNLTKTKVTVKGPFKGKEHPTYFRFKDKAAGTELVRHCAENFRCALSFETDATEDYFTRTVDAGKRMVYRVAGDQRVPVESFNGPFLDKGEATLRVKLPPNAELGDTLSYVLVVEDTLRDEPFENRFTINVTAAVTPKPGKPGKKKEKKDKDEDTEHEIEVESGMSLPRIIPIYEDKWEAQEPPFNRYTALRIQISSVPGNGDGQDVYDYLINMDNLYLKAEEKNAKEDLKLLQARYQYGLVLLGLALVNDDAQEKKRKEGVDDPAPEDREEDAVETRVEHITRAIAPVLLPMINQLGSIELDMPVVIDDSGEAA
jgi:hypothetical protein